jgi:hypothetical protein
LTWLLDCVLTVTVSFMYLPSSCCRPLFCQFSGDERIAAAHAVRPRVGAKEVKFALNRRATGARRRSACTTLTSSVTRSEPLGKHDNPKDLAFLLSLAPCPCLPGRRAASMVCAVPSPLGWFLMTRHYRRRGPPHGRGCAHEHAFTHGHHTTTQAKAPPF